MKLKARFLAAALAASGFAASAADYYVVTAIKGKTYRAADIQVSLAAGVLPSAKATLPYAGFDFRPSLSISGDPTYTGSGISWRVASGAIPSGMSFADGVLAGTPSAEGDNNFTLEAAYRDKVGAQSYALRVDPLVINVDLASRTLARGKASQPYPQINFNENLAITGDIPYTGTGVSWRVASGAVPAGMSFADGVLSGTPSAAATSNFTLEATFRGVSSSQAYMLAVDAVATAAWDPNTRKAPNCLAISGASAYPSGCGGSQASVAATVPKSSGKWYYEVQLGQAINYCQAGVMPMQHAGQYTQISGAPTGTVAFSSDGGIHKSYYSSFPGSIASASGGWVGVAYDLDAMTVSFIDASGTKGPFSLGMPAGTPYLAAVSVWGGCGATANFGASPFVRAKPVGFEMLN